MRTNSWHTAPKFWEGEGEDIGFNIFGITLKGFPGGVVVKNLPAIAGDARDSGSIPGSGKSPGVGDGNPLQYSWLVNSMDSICCWATVHGVTKVRHNWVTKHAQISL